MAQTLLEPTLPRRLNAPHVHRLPNGLTIIAEQLPIDAVNLSLWLGVGSAAEANSINGMAHFLEHMIFKGTEHLQSGEFERYVEQRGAVTNAATSQDYTQYYITTAPQDFAALAPHQIEVVLNAAIPDEAFERERLVVMEEIRRSQDSPQRRTFYRSMELAFDELPYRRAVLGPIENIQNFTPHQMRQFHRTWYNPQSITAVVVGNLPVEQLIQVVTEGFDQAIARRCFEFEVDSLPLQPLSYQPEAQFSGIERRSYVDPTLQQARLVMLWRVPGLLQLEQTHSLDVLASVLGRGRTSRLVRDLRENRQLVNSISVSNVTYRHQGLFYLSATLPAENLEIVEEAITQHIEQLHSSPATEAELQRIRTLVANRFVFANETPSDRAGLYGYYQSVVGDLKAAITYPDLIQSIELEDLQVAAQQYLTPGAYGIVTLRPE
ncbi:MULTISPECIES: pitrilysin family protein [unclassified Leptolyngbya]|uniref:M16 family metallopeptidase n=1 Tax=unclassified Leptolyngbya TaxID=2650499 RepID=UPI001688D20A|nr:MULTISPECIES: pitrilysin family protein [unclassified Leptolyngbya]MBD1912602.1 insulinase family protein [Leptolyngbya sp. FACHB-8]MBD2156771.1 insulinase family protein [Leptolyngbya sp. FACHB-16]